MYSFGLCFLFILACLLLVDFSFSKSLGDPCGLPGLEISIGNPTLQSLFLHFQSSLHLAVKTRSIALHYVFITSCNDPLSSHYVPFQPAMIHEEIFE
jgi:hypothetical protein